MNLYAVISDYVQEGERVYICSVIIEDSHYQAEQKANAEIAHQVELGHLPEDCAVFTVSWICECNENVYGRLITLAHI